MAPSEEGAGAPKGFRGATEGEITRACCLHRGLDEHQMKRRSFAFSLAYIKCFRTYSVYLSFRHGVLILYRRAPKLTASERKIVTKETHQGCLSFLFKSPLLAKARRGRSRAAHRNQRLRLFALALADGSGLPPRCIRHRRRSKAKPLRGRRGRSRAMHRVNALRKGR